MMKLRKTLYFVLCFMVSVCTLSGCIEEYEADISADDSNLLVVEGAICSKQNKFYLSRTQAINSSYVPKVVSEAKVLVRGSDGSTEICACKLSAILIPLPFAADNHQLANARVLEKAGAAVIREEKELTAASLSETILDLLKDEEKRRSMAEAGEKVFIKDASFELLKFIMAV